MISSSQNERVKYWFSLKDKKNRDINKEYIIEGEHLVSEAYKYGFLKSIIYCGELGSDYEKIDCIEVSRNIIEKLSSTPSPQNVLGIARFFDEDKTINNDKIILNLAINYGARSEIVEMVKNKGLTVSKYSENIDSQVVVIDSFGLLESLYVSATKIFIGGSIVNIGGHNIFEALQFEKQIAVGNNMQDFAEIYEPAKKYNLVENVNSSQDIAIWLQKEYDKKDFSNFFEEINNKNKNITETIEELINDVLSC